MKKPRIKVIVSILSLSVIFLSLFPRCAISPSNKTTVSFTSELVEIDTRPGITLKFILLKPEEPVASVILFAGGQGILDLYSLSRKPMITRGNNIFVVSTRKNFAEHNFMVALVDMPPDYKKNVGNYGWWIDWPERHELFRMSVEHGQDIEAVADFLKNKSNVPVWLVGTSRGTISATNGAIRNKGDIDGLVLTSSLTRTKNEWHRLHRIYPNYIIDMELDKINVPTLVVAHKDDKCFSTPSVGAERIKNALINAKDVEVMYFTGGKATVQNECWGQSAHGFYGIEEKVVSAIAEFIKSK